MTKLLAATPFLLSSILGFFIMYLMITGAFHMGAGAEIVEFSLGFALFVFGAYAAFDTLTYKSK